ncbi:hypothetical protein BBJ28_00019639, partial [Nothophytophthora sp. Chile5]
VEEEEEESDTGDQEFEASNDPSDADDDITRSSAAIGVVVREKVSAEADSAAVVDAALKTSAALISSQEARMVQPARREQDDSNRKRRSSNAGGGRTSVDEIVRESVGSRKSSGSARKGPSTSPAAVSSSGKSVADANEPSSSEGAAYEKLKKTTLAVVDEEKGALVSTWKLREIPGGTRQEHATEVVGGDNKISPAAAANARHADQETSDARQVEVVRDMSLVAPKAIASSKEPEPEVVVANSRTKEGAPESARTWKELATSSTTGGISKLHKEGTITGETDSSGISMDSNEPKLTRKSMQVRSANGDQSSPLLWNRKSILRKASSLAPSTRSHSRKVSFAANDKVDSIVEDSQPDVTQPEPNPEGSSAVDVVSTVESNRARSVSTPKADTAAKPQGVSTPEAPSASLPSDDRATPKAPLFETDAERKRREFQESVNREAQRLRMAAKLSAKKRFEEAKASNAFWAKREQLKLKLQASTSGGKATEAQASSSSSSGKTTQDQQLLVTTPDDSTSATNSFDLRGPTTGFQAATPAEVVERAQTAGMTLAFGAEVKETAGNNQVVAITRVDPKGGTELQSERASSLRVGGNDTAKATLVQETTSKEAMGSRATYSTVESEHQAERAISLRPVGKPAARSMPSSGNAAKEPAGIRATHPAAEKQQSIQTQTGPRPPEQRSTVVASKASEAVSSDAKASRSPVLPALAPSTSKTRSDSMSSTVSSLSESSPTKTGLKNATSTAPAGGRKPISNLMSGLHSFTTLLDKDRRGSRESTGGRNAPVVNALKLAEKSRLLEEKKKQEKEKRKAALKKKLDEHKRAAALKEKAERDAKEKRELERLNERKKREAELAKKRQQKVQEMRAGLEKKRALLAAEKKSGKARRSGSNSGVPSKSTAAAAVSTASTHHKHRGLASASEASKPPARPVPKRPTKAAQKPAPKPATIPVPKSVAKSASNPASKPLPKPTATPSAPAKQAPQIFSPELVNYEMSDNAESSDDGKSDSDDERHGSKKVPKWAQKDHLNKTLRAQFGKNAVDPSPSIFVDFVDTCDLEAIFEPTDVRKKKKFARRTSSGNWLADRPTARDRALYQRDMGYDL